MARAITGDPALSVEQVETGGSIAEQIRVGAAILRTLNERSWLVAEILRSQAAVTPELAELASDWRRRHLDAVTRGVATLVKARALRPGITAEEAADILYAVGGTDLYRALVRERGWSPGKYEDWLAGFIQEHVARSSPGPG